MSEMLDIYTPRKEKIETMDKRQYYGLTNDIPWIKCCTCFVIDSKNKNILFEKRGKRFLDPGKLDLCSGHVQSGEIPIQGMVRELDEELGIPENISRSLFYLGEIPIDYTQLNDETNKKNLKCFVSCYALKLIDSSIISLDGREAISMGWLSFDDSIGFIKNNMTRIPYEECLEKYYKSIFEKLEGHIYPNRNLKKEEIK